MRLRYAHYTLTPGGEARCEPENVEELVEEIERALNAGPHGPHFPSVVQMSVVTEPGPATGLLEELVARTSVNRSLILRHIGLADSLARLTLLTPGILKLYAAMFVAREDTPAEIEEGLRDSMAAMLEEVRAVKARLSEPGPAGN